MNSLRLIHLLYITFHLIGFGLCVLSVIGLLDIPSDPKTPQPLIRFIEFLMLLGWLIPVYLLTSIACFVLNKSNVAKGLSYLSLAIGLLLILTVWWMH